MANTFTSTRNFSTSARRAPVIPAIAADAGRYLRLVLSTAGALALCGVIAALAFYLTNLFNSGSYKLAAAFIACIIISNVVSKCVLWWYAVA